MTIHAAAQPSGAYAAVRTSIAAVWFTMLATLPAYAAAALLLAWPPARRARVGPATSPHDVRAVADDWSGTAGPYDRAAQLGTRSCAVCGRPPDDLLLAPPEPGA